MSYSLDLRTRVVGFVENGGRVSNASKLFKVGYATVYRWINLKKETNSLAKRPLNRIARKVSVDVLIKRIEDNPDILLREHAQHFGVCVQTISVILRNMGITRKKRSLFTKKEMKIKDPPI